MKLSFSLSSKASSTAPDKPPRSFSQDDDAGAAAAAADHQPQYVTVFDPSDPLPAAPSSNLVISPIPNAEFRPAKKMKNIFPPSSSGDPDPDLSSDTHFVLDTSGPDAPAGSVRYGLTVRESISQRQSKDEADAGDPQLAALRRYQEEMKNLPDDEGLEAFSKVPIESFGTAVLAGYGWSKGMGIGKGNKVDTKVVEYDRRQGTVGIGYDPSSDAAVKRKDRKPPAKEEKVVRVISGRHIGAKAKIIEAIEKQSTSAREVILKLLQSGEEVRVRGDMIADLGSTEEEKCLRKLKELDLHGNGDTRSRDSRKGEKRGRGEERKPISGSHENRKGSKKERGPIGWLTSRIRVRIISKEFKGGRWYLKKGEIVDVVSPTTCDLSMDGSGELLQGVDQEILETALPKHGGSVLVLYGRHKGVYGKLLEKDSEEETGLVRDADSHALIKVRLEQIAEYIGDPSYLGY